MPTPASGAISMNDMRTHINRATGSSISMSEMRARYGGSGSISFSDLRNCEGFVVTVGKYYSVSKFFSADLYGWDGRLYNFGSVSPNEANGVQVASNSYIYALYSANGTTSGTMALSSNTTFGAEADFTTGYRGTNVTRLVTANTACSITGSSNTSVSFTYSFPTTGTVHCLVKF